MGPPLMLWNGNKILEENSGLLLVDHSIPTRTSGAVHPLVLSFPRPSPFSLDKVNFVACVTVRVEYRLGSGLKRTYDGHREVHLAPLLNWSPCPKFIPPFGE